MMTLIVNLARTRAAEARGSIGLFSRCPLPPNHLTLMKEIKQAVRQGYGATAKAGLHSGQAAIEGIAKAFGYSASDLASIPAEANMGLSCGNPLATASLRSGETVLDLGSGGGLDVFLASKQVGPSGEAIGLDMTGEMIDLARANAEKGGFRNVRFLLGEIEAIPLPDNSVDCVISNCVINLCPDKPAALAEVFRVLKPGGRLAISDIALRQTLPKEVEEKVAAWTGCIAGALPMEAYAPMLQAAGFQDAHVQETGSDLNAYAEGGNAACCAPPAEAASALPSASEESACCAPDPTGESCCAPNEASGPSLSDVAVPTEESACCTPTPDAEACCEPNQATQSEETLPTAQAMHEELSEVLQSFDVNAFAASVRVFAIKP